MSLCNDKYNSGEEQKPKIHICLHGKIWLRIYTEEKKQFKSAAKMWYSYAEPWNRMPLSYQLYTQIKVDYMKTVGPSNVKLLKDHTREML